MRLNATSLGLAGAATAAIVFSICSLFVALVPRGTSQVFSYVLHLDLTGLARAITWGSYCAGVVTISVGVGLMLWLVARLYNQFARGPGAPAA